MINANGTSPAALDVIGLWVGYNNTAAITDVTFSVPEGEIMGIIGPNGAGKSTLFSTILGLLPPWKGNISIFGRPDQANRSVVGYMPQVEMVDWEFPISVEDVVLMGRYNRMGLLKRPSKLDHDAVYSTLENVGMASLGNRLIKELSGGQRRRILLARALANSPKLLLLDEPLAGLDASAQHQLITILRDLRSKGITVVLSTHDLSCVSAACDLTLCLNRRVVACGIPSEVLVEPILGETFGTHLLLVHIDGQAYAYQHHHHPDPIEPEDNK